MAKNLTPIDYCLDEKDNIRINNKLDILEETVLPGIVDRWLAHETYMANERYRARKSGKIVIDPIYQDYAPLLCLKSYGDGIIMLLNRLVVEYLEN